MMMDGDGDVGWIGGRALRPLNRRNGERSPQLAGGTRQRMTSTFLPCRPVASPAHIYGRLHMGVFIIYCHGPPKPLSRPCAALCFIHPPSTSDASPPRTRSRPVESQHSTCMHGWDGDWHIQNWLLSHGQPADRSFFLRGTHPCRPGPQPDSLVGPVGPPPSRGGPRRRQGPSDVVVAFFHAFVPFVPPQPHHDAPNGHA